MLPKLAFAILAVLASTSEAAKCQNLTIPVSVSARNGVFNLAAPSDTISATNFILDLSRQGHNLTKELLTGYNTVSGNYEIAATYCEPDSGPASTLQVLTHGIGFDRSYWDFSYANYNYSYVRDAVDQYGYSTFAWDRLGIGMSSLGEPVNEIQLWLEVAALQQLTLGLRGGSISGISPKYEKIVHVGHSFGSEMTYTLTSMYPSISDGIVLTGFSNNGSFTAFFELGSNFIIANTVSALSKYPTGYLAPSSAVGAQIDFFSPGDFDPNVLQVAYMTGQPVTPGELLTIAGTSGMPSTFSKPVLVITGERDVPYCGGDCFATGDPALASVPAASKMFFPDSSAYSTFVVPGAGHGLNLEYSHTTTYSTILNFLIQNGLAVSASTKTPTSSSASASATWALW